MAIQLKAIALGSRHSGSIHAAQIRVCVVRRVANIQRVESILVISCRVGGRGRKKT
jgi:hypothetical protein